MTTINIFVDEYEKLKKNREKYPNLFNRIENLNEEYMTDWLRLDVNEEALKEFELLKNSMGEI